MKRIIISLTVAQHKWLASEAKKRGISLTEVVRRLLDKEIEK